MRWSWTREGAGCQHRGKEATGRGGGTWGRRVTGETGTGFLQVLQQEGCWKAPGAISENGLWTPGRGPPAVDVPTAASDLGTLSPQPWEARECAESLLQQPSQAGGFVSPAQGASRAGGEQDGEVGLASSG